jgi:hypothetical protein
LPICSFTNFLSAGEVSNILLVSDNQFRGRYGINCLQHCLLISCDCAWHQLLHLLVPFLSQKPVGRWSLSRL